MKHNIIIIGFIVICLFGSGWIEGNTYKPMQEDFDKIRLDHILYINSIIKEYKAVTGKYPFENDSTQLPVIVIIQTDRQKETHKGNVPLFLNLESRASNGKIPDCPKRIDRHTVQELEKLLSDGLKRNITLPKDPQKVPVNKPSVYIYTYYLNVYDITAFLHHELSFSRKLSPFNNKITIGSRSVPAVGMWKAEDLMQSGEFRKFFLSKFNRPGYKLKTSIQ